MKKLARWVLVLVAAFVALNLLGGCEATGSGPLAQQAEESPSVSDDSDEADGGDDSDEHDDDSRVVRFGETVRFNIGYSSGDHPVEVTVSRPQEFSPKKGAGLYQTLDQQYDGIKPRWMNSNVYFDVTVTNRSLTEDADRDVFTPTTSVRGTGSDEHSFVITKGDYIYLNCPCKDSLNPGKSTTLREGWTVKSADKIKYVVEYSVLKTGYHEVVVWTS